MSKKVVSECCNAQVEHYPFMNGIIFFCTKCSKECKAKVIKEEKVEKK